MSRVNAVSVTVDGIKFTSISECAEFYQISKQTLIHRIQKRGMRAREAVKTPIKKSNKKALRIGNKTYASVRQLADEFGLPYATVRHRIRSQGMSPKQAITKPIQRQVRQSVTAFGKVYPTLSAAARAHKEDPEQVRQRVKKGMSLEDALLGKNARKQVVTVLGKTYSSKVEAAEAFGMSRSAFFGRLRQGWDIESALTSPVVQTKKLKVQGKIYESVADLARAYDMPYRLVYKRIHVFGWRPLKAVTEPKVLGREIVLGNKTFPTIEEAARSNGLDAGVVWYRLSAGWPLEKAFDPDAKSDNKLPISIDDERFPTLSDAARCYGVKETTFMKRLRSGWSPEQAAGLLEPPTVKKGKHPVTASSYRKRLREVHGKMLDFSKAKFARAQDAVEVICKADKPHPTFFATPNNLLRGKGCPICKISHGAKRIARWLEKNNINYEVEWTKHGLRSTVYDRATLRFDFYLPRRRILIEYDGEQHFRPVRFGDQTQKQADEALKRTKLNDRRKNRWAKANGFQMIRIKFDESPVTVLEKRIKVRRK